MATKNLRHCEIGHMFKKTYTVGYMYLVFELFYTNIYILHILLYTNIKYYVVILFVICIVLYSLLTLIAQ